MSEFLEDLELGEILDRDQRHEEQEKHEEDLMKPALDPLRHRTPLQLLDEDEEDPSAVERRYREDVEDAEVDREERRELEEVRDPEVAHLLREDDDPDRSGHIDAGRLADEAVAARASE